MDRGAWQVIVHGGAYNRHKLGQTPGDGERQGGPSWYLPIFCPAEDETQVRDLLLTYLSLLQGAVPPTIG